MKRVSEHLEQLHKIASHHHQTMSEAHLEAMGDEEKGSARHSFHKAAAAAHASAADSHDRLLDEAQKAVIAGDLEKSTRVVPDRISAVYPGVRAIPRTGQREPAQGDRPKVDLALETFVKVDDD